MGEWWALGQAEGAGCVGRGEGMAEPPAQSGDWDGHRPHTAQRGFSLTVPGPGTQGGLGTHQRLVPAMAGGREGAQEQKTRGGLVGFFFLTFFSLFFFNMKIT